MDIAKILGQFVYDLDLDKVPEDVKEKARTCFMNSIGVGVSGFELGPATHARNVAKVIDLAPAEGPSATLMMDGTKLNLQGAVFANTVLFHSRAQEDTMGGTHNGTMIVPAVIAIAENYPCTGKQMLEATLAGYEVTGALEYKMSRLSNPRGFRPSAIFVCFGVAAACAKLLGCDAKQIADAISITASLAGGIQESFAAGTTEWFYQNACAARNGVMAAFLAKDGVEGAKSAFFGRRGYMNVFAGSNDEELVKDTVGTIGEVWNMRRVTFKLNPCCMIAQTPFYMTQQLAIKEDIDHTQVESVEYHMGPFESNYSGTKYMGPFTTDTQTTMSCAFNLANAIVNRRCTKKGMQVFDDERILNIVSRTTVVDDDKYPDMCGRVIITMKDGTVYEDEMMIDESFYDLSWDQNADMMRNIHDEVGIAKEKTEKLLDIVKNFEKYDNVSELIETVKVPQ